MPQEIRPSPLPSQVALISEATRVQGHNHNHTYPYLTLPFSIHYLPLGTSVIPMFHTVFQFWARVLALAQTANILRSTLGGRHTWACLAGDWRCNLQQRRVLLRTCTTAARGGVT